MKWLVKVSFLFFSILSFGNQKSIVLMDNVILYLNEVPVTSEFNSLSKILNVNYLCFIDEKLVFGTDFLLPKTKLQSAYLLIDNTKVNLNVTNMYNPNIQLLSNKSFKIIKENDIYIITGLFSDGAGSYIVQWIVNNYSSSRIIISNDEKILVHLFYD